jgi:hypothetical protein
MKEEEEEEERRRKLFFFFLSCSCASWGLRCVQERSSALLPSKFLGCLMKCRIMTLSRKREVGMTLMVCYDCSKLKKSPELAERLVFERLPGFQFLTPAFLLGLELTGSLGLSLFTASFLIKVGCYFVAERNSLLIR